MITLINPPAIKTFSGLQMHTPNPPLGLAYIAAAIKDAGLPYQVIDGTGEALGVVRPYPDRADFMIQGLSFDEITGRIHPDAEVVGVACMFSTLWPLVNKMAWAVREKFPNAWMVLGGGHGTTVPENVLKVSPFDAVVLGEGEDTAVELLRAGREGRPLSQVRGIAFKDADRVVKTGLSARKKDVDKIELDGDFFVSPMDFYTQKAPSYADAISTRRLYWTMIWMFWNFYLLSFLFRSLRVIRTLVKAVTTGTEDTRYANWFGDRFYTRRRWRKLAETAHR